jgi:hypothetical protein
MVVQFHGGSILVVQFRGFNSVVVQLHGNRLAASFTVELRKYSGDELREIRRFQLTIPLQ